jgi:hypothetical protein
VIRAIKKGVGELGLLSAALYWFGRALVAVSGGAINLRHYVFVAQPLQPFLQRAGAAQGTSISEIGVDDLGDLQAPVPASELWRRLRQGSLGLRADIRSTFAGYLWLHTGPFPEDEVECWFEPSPAATSAWDFDAYVVPEFRATRVFQRLWQSAAVSLERRKVTHSFSRIAGSNLPSLRVHARSGAFYCGEAAFLQFGRRHVALCWGGVKKLTHNGGDRRPRYLIPLSAHRPLVQRLSPVQTSKERRP